jgi:signal transduction histidine kinase/ActR/RegA family two-component response regulator
VKAYASRYSIGQRLALGLGFLFALQLAVLAGVLIWLHEDDKAYQELRTSILPREALANELERTVLRVSVAVRDHLFEPTPVHRRAFTQAAEGARTTLRFVGAVPASLERDAYGQARLLVERYINEAERLAAGQVERPIDELAKLRESTLTGIRQFVQQEQAAVGAALEAMDANRQRISQMLAWLAAGSAALFAVAGWLTARSIRRPVRRLFEVATALESGNWRSALSLEPASPQGSGPVRDEMLHLGHAFGAAAVALEAREQQLQQQNEELQAQNEEIQAQNEEIQAQGEELQAQNEEIQAQNADLVGQTALLREHASALAEADAKKNEFLGVLAHELRNPLAPMTNSLALLRRTGAGADAARAHAILERQLRHLVRLIDDLLDVTRISRGKIHLRREPLDLGRLLRDCAADLKSSIDGKGLRLALALPEEPLWVAGDYTRLSQVFGNILGNAIKFTDAGGRVAVSAAGEAGQAVVRIADDGRGMDAALLGRLFEPFSQGDSELARSSGGLGLGLALVKGMVELHGGRVEARSDGPGRGAELVVHLPLGEAPALEAQTTQPAPLPARRCRILIVEDNADAAESLRTLLELDGHEVRTERTGAAALEAARGFQPEVVLCDIGLPGLDGYEVARALRCAPGGTEPLLIALTGYAADADHERTARAGFDHHFAKPPDLERLNRLLAGREARPPRSACA